ncbi:redox-regulated ATPase YchF [Rhodopila sp.]|uniref:redox-regulated ATPase YchF n=1 Tax=Rhodopila sp. TaxID=2480087 RepID=UPI002C049058|nr:redox-regulated ATPase YchF [Rhodopila sp.]HVZ09841.1 redox-regulated ATPase YchF [Rhodopila sp.]
MGFKCGIVGLPNVGKSTLFNALTQTAAAQAANYPFCTIEPNVGDVAVPDPRLETLAGIAGSGEIIPTRITFVDIAGLVRGASKGEGLGNQFLANIREVDAIIHVLRCFEDADITHVEGSIDPLRDIEVVETELMLSDLESLEKRLTNAQKRARGGDRESVALAALMEPLVAALQAGKPARTAIPPGEEEAVRRLQLLTSKPVLYVCNVEEASAATGNAFSAKVRAFAAAQGAPTIVVSAAIEAEVSQLPEADRGEFLEGLGLTESGLDQVIRAGYQLLDLLTYFTCGPKETRAWTIVRGTRAPQAAAVIHKDFERGFIACETISYDDYVACRGEQGAKEAGRMRVEGKNYEVQDGDVLLFRFNV